MSRQFDIINELEIDYGVQLHANDIPDILCNGDGCRRAECSCWSDFETAVEAILIAQVKATEIVDSGFAKLLNQSHLRREVA